MTHPGVTGKPCWTRTIALAVCAILASGGVFSQTTVPDITLAPGEFFFRLDGTPSLLLGTNPSGWMLAQFDTLLGWAGRNERIVRIHLTNGRVPARDTTPGEVDEDWAAFWDAVLTTAEQNGLQVLPVFEVWADWNESNTGTQSWGNNPYNVANGGPAANPLELLQDTEARQLWLQWLQILVIRWEGRPNILGWEVFSELNLITGASEAAAVGFVESAAAVIRGADTRDRPVTSSLAGINDWPALSQSDAMDFIQIHPYAENPPSSGNLDALILTTVRQRLTQYGKPVFIGECGLDSRPPVDPVRDPQETLTMSSQAPVGINHAIWASVVSGAMNGRMLWFEDGYDQYHQTLDGDPLDLRTSYQDASAAVARFLQGVDFSGFSPIDLVVSDDITGSAIGNDDMVLGWVRDIESAAPEWPARSLDRQTITVAAPAQSRVTFYDTGSGETVQSVYASQEPGGSVSFALPSFEGSIAFKISAATSYSVTDLGGTSLSSQGASANTIVGYARVRPDTGATTPSGVAIFGFTQDGVLVAEAGVPASLLVISGRIFAEVGAAVSTGLAMANPNGQDAAISFYFTDTAGTDFGHGNFNLGANQQTAKFLNQDPFNSGSPVLGTFTFTSSVPVTVIALKGLTNQRNEFLITTLPVSPLEMAAEAEAAVEDTTYFPHFADGGGWTTEVILVNPTETTITGTVRFLGPGDDTTAGAPVSLALTDGQVGSEFSYSIPPRSAQRFQTSNPDGATQSGSVRVVRDAGSSSPAGLTVFSFTSGAVTVSEAGVPAQIPGSAFRVYVEVTGTPGDVRSVRSGVAITNTGSMPTTTTFELTDLNGTPIGQQGSLPVPASGQIAKFVDEILTSLSPPYSGILRVTSDSTEIAIVGLRSRTNDRSDFLITTTPPSRESDAASSSDVYFPHIADSGGWTTQFILFSGVAGQTSSGALQFFDQSGQVLDLSVSSTSTINNASGSLRFLAR